MKNKKTIAIFILFLLTLELYFSLDSISNNQKIIFTFWEPKEKIPGYIKLCIKTWKKFLPDYTIYILDFKTAKELLGEKFFSKIICNNMLLMVQSDAIRVAILNKFGGVWIDADTIILNDKILKYFHSYELAMIWEESVKLHYIAFIYALKKSTLIKQWKNHIIIKVKKYKEILYNKENTSNWLREWNKVNSWKYLGNSIIEPLLKNTSGRKFIHKHSDDIKVCPELIYMSNSSLDNRQKYVQFYFSKLETKYVLNNNDGLIFLHNSWTPLKYKQMSDIEFLKQDILLSKLFAELLD